IPCEGAYVFSDRWSLDELVYGAPSEGPYQTNLPSPDDIISYVREDREGQVTRIHHQEEIEENVFCLGGNRDHVPACLCYMLYYVANSERFNLAYFMAKRIEWVTKQARLILPYGMLLTRLLDFIIGEIPKLKNESYVLYDRVMNPLAAQLERKPRRDRGTRRGRHSTSSSSAFDQPSSSHLNDDDDDGNDEGTSHASTPSPIPTQEALFSLKIHYAGCFTESPARKYVNGDFAFLIALILMSFLYTRIMIEYIRLGYKMIEVYIEHDKTTVFTYIEDAYNTPSKKCVIIEYPEGWKENDANEICESGTRHEDGKSSQPKTTTDTTQTEFATNFYTTGDPLMGQDFDPFFGLDSAPVDAINIPTTKADCVAVEDENRDGDSSDSDGYSSESDGLVDVENELVDVEVDMDGFDRANDNIMGNEGATEFNADEDFDIGIEVVDNDEFESASDKEGIDKIRTRKLKQLMKQNQINEGGLHKVHFYVGQEFPSSAEVKELVHKHSIETRRELFLKKNDKVRLRAECRGTIPVFHANSKVGSSQVVGPSQTVGPSQGSQTKWTKGKIATSKGIESPLKTWQVKTFDDTHKYLQSRKIKYLTSEFLSQDIMDQIETNPKIPIKAIQDQLQKKFQLEVSRMKAFRAKAKAVEHVRGDFTLQYKQPGDYVMELQQSNPNTTVRIEVESEADHTKPTRVFKRIYVCLGASKEGVQASVGVDPNNGIYPLAYGVVETESRESWTWFLSHLKEDLDLQDNSNFTFISDRQKATIGDLFPAAEHRYCLRHIHENMKLRWRGTTYKELLWKAASALTVPHFEYNMEKLKAFNKDCYDWLAKIPPIHWARSHFSVFDENGLVTVKQAQASECKAEYNGGHLYGVTGPWVASNWNMAANKMEVGLPESWVHPCYRLKTWIQVYSHHINPIRGKIMWPKCPIPTTILPPNQHPQVGRPNKARKKSDGEDIKMVNNGKLSRKSKTVTCFLCKSKGHNKRSCKGVSSNAGNKSG
ncbi:mutator type transposase, partial [Tanacetum coccineum]